MKKLPIGISTLAEIRANDYVFIDKTRHVANLVSAGKYYFLSRPRRFGKSLFLDTLKQAFLGRKDLFTGLYLEQNWDWNKSYPVIHFDFGAGIVQSRHELDIKIGQFLDEYYSKYAIENIYEDISGRFSYLIRSITENNPQLVILIDEYDKPILDNITNKIQAIEMREMLKDLYSIIKECDEYIKFVLLTGVSKFSKVSLFSGLNILDDISLNTNYADICGYTQSELEQECAEHLAAGQVDKAKLKLWYNGYNFAGSEEQKVYNPFDILLFFDSNYEYRSYWFETATPTFLVRLIESEQYYIPDLEEVLVPESSLSSFDVDEITLTTLLFQTGYLTIKRVTQLGTQMAYVLGYPNLEVKASLNDKLATIGTSLQRKDQVLGKVAGLFLSNKFADLKSIFSSHFASIPHDWYRNNNIANYEGFYASIVYSYLAALGYDLRAEDTTNQGRIDLTMIMPDKVIILEFKLTKYGSASEALEQIKAKGYASKYLAENKPIYLLGISFDAESKNVVECLYEVIS